MPRPKTMPDNAVLDAALALIHGSGPEALTFEALGKACRLSPATLVQRFASKARLRQAALLRAWDGLDAKTARLAAEVERTPAGAVALLVGLSQDYGGIDAYAEGLLVLREDLRDPMLRARGAKWRDVLCEALGQCFSAEPTAPADVGLLMASHWQGALLWWSFDPQGDAADYVERSLRDFVRAVVGN